MSNVRRAGARRKRNRLWAESLEYALDEVFELMPLPWPGLVRPQVRVLDVSPRGLHVDIEVRFLAGKSYCCCDWGCFARACLKRWWDAARVLLRDVSDRDPPPMSVLAHCVVEQGALLMTIGSPQRPGPCGALQYSGNTRYERDAHSF